MNKNQIKKRGCFFIHIPKTAGTSVSLALRNIFNEKEVFFNKHPDDLNEYLSMGSADKKCFLGHYYYDQLNNIKLNPVVITFLRDPIERVISHYYYYKNRPDEIVRRMSDYDKYVYDLTQKYTFSEFITLDDNKIDATFSNLQTRQLANNPRIPIPKDLDKRKKLCDLAIQHIDRIDFVGIVEMYDDSINLLSRKYTGKKMQLRNDNVNNKKNISDEDYDVFKINDLAKSRVDLDFIVYNYAVKKLIRELSIG